MRIPEFWITAETVARSPDVAFSHSLKKAPLEKLTAMQRRKRHCKRVEGRLDVNLISCAICKPGCVESYIKATRETAYWIHCSVQVCLKTALEKSK